MTLDVCFVFEWKGGCKFLMKEGKFALSKMQMNNNGKVPKEIWRYMILDKID
jgi:hypothetical protein